MIWGLLKRVNSTHKNLRTDTMLGYCEDLPKVGNPFTMYGQPLDPNSVVRVIQTSPVIETDGEQFRTANSTYEFTVRVDPEDDT